MSVTVRRFASEAVAFAGTKRTVDRSSAEGRGADGVVNSDASVVLEPCLIVEVEDLERAGWSGFLHLCKKRTPREPGVSVGQLETNLVGPPLQTGSSLPSPAESA